jgi:hypothetical protein
MAAGKYTFIIEQGATTDFEVQYSDANDLPLDLTGYSGKMQIKSDFSDNNPTTYLTLSSSLAADGTGLNFYGSRSSKPLTSGSIGIFISPEYTKTLTFDTAKYDLLITSGSISHRIIEGNIKLTKRVTI